MAAVIGVWVSFFLLPFAWGEEPQEWAVVRSEFVFQKEMASCALIEARDKDRQIILNEIEQATDFEDLLKDRSLMDFDHALREKLFYDPVEWSTDYSSLRLSVKVPDKVMSTLTDENWQTLNLEVFGAGIRWKAPVERFPEEFLFEWLRDEGFIEIEFPVFGRLFCAPEDEQQVVVIHHPAS